MVLGLLLALALHPYEAVEPHMGTLFRIKLYAQSPDQAQTAFRAAFGRVAELDEILSDYKPNSELNRFCRAGHAELSGDLFQVLEKAQELAVASDGAFDVTVGPLTHLWRRGRVPERDAVTEALQHVGFRKLHLQPAVLDQPGMQLDVGGIAKGYAADAALEVITNLGIRSALVAASGDLAFSDAPPGRSGWKIGIDQVNAPVMELHNAAVSTSGNTEQHVDSADGVRYSHIIDPRTGMGLTEDLKVTVIAPKAVTADSLATAISVLGEAKGRILVSRQADVSVVVNGRVK